MFTSENRLDKVAAQLGGFRTDGHDGYYLADGLVIASLDRGRLYVAGQGYVTLTELPAIVAEASRQGAASGVRLLMKGSRPVQMTLAQIDEAHSHRSLLDHVVRRSVQGIGTFLWADTYLGREAADVAEALTADHPGRQVVLAPSYRGAQVIVTDVAKIAEAARWGIRWPASDAERAELEGLTEWMRQASSEELLERLDQTHHRTVGARRLRGVETGVWA